MNQAESRYISPLGDLLDLLSITKLRIHNSVGDPDSSEALKGVLVREISERIASNKIELSEVLELIIQLSQANQEIWSLKEAMSALEPASQEYSESLILAHQLNGFRNVARNELSSQDKLASQLVRSNTETDGLKRS